VDVEIKDGSGYKTRKEENVSILTVLGDAGVDTSAIAITVEQPSFGGPLGLVVAFVPLILVLGFVAWLAAKVAKRS
jgi:hypothetical protein